MIFIVNYSKSYLLKNIFLQWTLKFLYLICTICLIFCFKFKFKSMVTYYNVSLHCCHQIEVLNLGFPKAEYMKILGQIITSRNANITWVMIWGNFFITSFYEELYDILWAVEVLTSLSDIPVILAASWIKFIIIIIIYYNKALKRLKIHN